MWWPILRRNTLNPNRYNKLKSEYQHIKPITISSDQAGPHLLIIAGVHGDEYEPILAVQRLIERFGAGQQLSKGKLTLLAVVNEPAHENGSRTGPDRLDLARICPGDADGSITEQIAREISSLIQSVDYLIDMHTGGKMYEIYPLSGYVLHTDQEILEKQRWMSQAFGLPVQWGTSPHLEGRTLSIARDAGVPAIYTEYGGGPSVDQSIVDALVRGCENLMISLELIPDKNLQNPFPDFIVEDFREESGHLQILYPAPHDGRLTSMVSLGEMVEQGQILGKVENSVTGVHENIHALEDGLVFILNRDPVVGKGVATAGVLPITSPGKITIS